jgi:hypothetical protein
MHNELVVAIEPLLAVPVAARMEASEGAGNREVLPEVLPEVAPQIAVPLEGLGAGFISTGKSELRFVSLRVDIGRLTTRYRIQPTEKEKKNSLRPSARYIRHHVCMNLVTERGIGILFSHIETRRVVRWQKGVVQH